MANSWTKQQLLDVTLGWQEFSQRWPTIGKEAWRHKWRGIKHGHILLENDAAPAEERVVNTTRPEYEVKEDGKIFINRSTRTVVTDLGEFGTVLFSFEKHAALRRRYADDWEGTGETIPTIARDFDLHPQAFNRYKTLHAWTHASDPFIDEEWEEGLTVEDAVAQTIESQRRAFHKKLQKEKWASLIADADKWRRFEELALDPIVEAVKTHAPYYIVPTQPLPSADQPFDLVFVPTDIHYGKRGWTDDNNIPSTLQDIEQLILCKTQQILDIWTRFGRPRKIITAVGSDYFHIDSYAGQTTSGTPQDMLSDPHSIVWDGVKLALIQLDKLREIAPLDIFYLSGNHDRMLGYALLTTVMAWFRNDDQVSINKSSKPRQYCRSGKTLLGFAHGDGAKIESLPLLMATEASDLWGQTEHRALFTGHKHFEMVRDIQGVVLYQMPSLSSDDRWHVQNGYVGNRKAVSAYIVDDTYGVIATIAAPSVNHEKL